MSRGENRKTKRERERERKVLERDSSHYFILERSPGQCIQSSRSHSAIYIIQLPFYTRTFIAQCTHNGFTCWICGWWWVMTNAVSTFMVYYCWNTYYIREYVQICRQTCSTAAKCNLSGDLWLQTQATTQSCYALQYLWGIIIVHLFAKQYRLPCTL